LSDVIVDIVETGNTLRDNGLEILEDLDQISARLIVNKVSYRFKYDVIQKIERILGGE
jgi:ATP phosphoribosyltransferase